MGEISFGEIKYDLGMFTSNLWQYIPGGTKCDDFEDSDYGGISFNGINLSGCNAHLLLLENRDETFLSQLLHE